MPARHIKALAAVALSLCFAHAAAADNSGREWRQVFLDGPIEATLPDGSTRVLDPSCSGGPKMTADGIQPADTQYSFFIRAGNPNKLLVAFDGGGACWDAFTCIASPLGGASTYTQEIAATPGRLEAGGGLFARDNPDNPFKEYTQVFIPYCSGDIHWGSADTNYVLPTQAGSLPWTIRHRGTDNFLAVLDWLQKNAKREYRVDLKRVKDVTVTGASAGGYGSMLGYAYVAEMTPGAHHNLVSDAAIGVINQAFFDAALYNPTGDTSWNIGPNLPASVPGFGPLLETAASNPASLVPMAFAALHDWKPDARYASLTTNLDVVQVAFYALMKGELQPTQATAMEWYGGMQSSVNATASLPNYRFFIEAGTSHTFIGDDQLTYEPGVHGVSVAEWVRAMVKPGNRPWDNLDAGAP